ncbi:MAG: addB [Herbinix sp.]|nr:addB [Herbinix sp.]
MSLQLILGSAGSGKSYQLYREVIQRSKEHPNHNYLVIVPEQFTLQTQKDIVTMHPEHGVMNVDILSFLRFAYRIFDELGKQDSPILEDTGKSMVLRRVVAQKKKDLILFGSNVRKPGFISELKSLLSELYQYNISSDDLRMMREAAEKKPVLRAKLQDILTIYQGFQEFIKERYITAEEIFVLLSDMIEQSQWLRDSVICLDGFTGFTPIQYKLLSKMIRLAKKVIITVTIDPRENIKDQKSEHQLFGLSKKTIHKLYQLAEDSHTVIEEPIYAENSCMNKVPYRFCDSKALTSLEHNLFRYPYKSYDQPQTDISIHAAKEPTSEIVFTAREIKRLVREEGYRYRDIAVVTADIEQYGRIAKRIFTGVEIPCFVDYKKEILNNPFVELLRAAVSIVNEDYSYESVFRYLRTGLTTISTEEIDMLENYVIAMGIRGSKRWKEPFTRSYRTREVLDLERLNEVRSKLVDQVQPFYEVLRDKEKTIKDFATAIYELGIRLTMEEQLDRLKGFFEEQNMPLYAKEYEQIYRIVMELYDQIVLLLGGEHCTAKEFGEILESGLSEEKVGLIPAGVDEVVVGDTERTRLKDIKVLFFVGMNDGIIPKSSGSGGILSDIERELLIEHHFELAPTKRQLAFIEQFYIYINMTKPKNKLYITYHKLNDEGKSVRPSYLIGKLKQLFQELPVVDEDETKQDVEHILSDRGLTYLAEGLRNFHGEEMPELWKELFLYYQSDEKQQRILGMLLEGAFYKNTDRGISKEAAALLYGNELKGSVTRLEKYAGCAFAHFLSYGLSLEERREYKLAVPDIGSIFHNAIDLFSKKLDLGDYSWHTIPDEVRENWAVECVTTAVEEFENSYLRSSKRNEYMIKRIERITIRTLWALCNQIKQGSFEPSGYEMPFYHVPDEMLTLNGRIDRLDLYEEDNKMYVRVIDYKSGHTSFDINSVYYGLQQQLAVYLSAAMDYLQKNHKDKQVVPSGIFYYHIDDPIVAKSAQSEEEIYKSLKMNGLVNGEGKILTLMDQKLATEEGTLRPSAKSDIIPIETNKEGRLNKRSSAANEKQIKALMNYVNKKLITDGKNILEGDAALNPYKMGDKTACDYCEFKTACGFDPKLPGNHYRNLLKKPADEMKAEIWGETN